MAIWLYGVSGGRRWMNMPIESSGRPWSKTKESPRSRAEDFLTEIDQYIVECYLCTPERVSDDTGY